MPRRLAANGDRRTLHWRRDFASNRPHIAPALPAFSIEDAAASLAHTLRRIDETAASEKPDLIALPEVTYPAYFLGTNDLSHCDVLSPADAAARFAEKARQHGVYIAAGLALDAPGGGYANGALLFGRDGSVAGRYDKSFLFHFDTRWFAPGATYPVFETDIGRIGMLVCADGRLPEIARSLMLNGAQIILDLTAWVSGGRELKDLSTSQVEFLMPARGGERRLGRVLRQVRHRGGEHRLRRTLALHRPGRRDGRRAGAG